MWHLTEKEYEDLLAKRTAPVFNPGKVPHCPILADGYRFASRAEYTRYGELQWLLAVHRIRDLRVHPKYTFVVNDRKIGTYTADFSYEECTTKGWISVVEDVKSTYTVKDPRYQRQKKLMWAHHNIAVRDIIY
jgi:Protein of unknown function (DUF1064)